MPLAPTDPAAPTDAPFFIPAQASLQERRPRTLKHGDSFAVFDHSGDAVAAPGSPEGLYHRDTRYLSQFCLTIGGQRPILLSSTVSDNNAALTCDLTNPDLFDEAGRLRLAHDLIHLRRLRFLWQGVCYERLSIHNFDSQPQTIDLNIAFAADFLDIFEVRGTHRPSRGVTQPPQTGRNRSVLSYVGLDGKRRKTILSFTPTPDRLTDTGASFRLDLQPRQTRTLIVEIGCDTDTEAGTGADGPVTSRKFLGALKDMRERMHANADRAIRVETSNEIFDEVVGRSLSDLAMLMTEKTGAEGEKHCFPYAGIPWFSTVFGRDALITAYEMLWHCPRIARSVLLHLAERQATETDPYADAEPGKILHEIRYGEMAELREVPFRRYYGSVDSTLLFVMLAGAYLRRTGDTLLMNRLWPNIEKALSWIEKYGDRDGDGFVEYGRRTGEGLINQAWKDSHDSVFHSDGALAEGPIAIAEVQAYAYGAWSAAAEIARVIGWKHQATQCELNAQRLRDDFDTRFFDEELGTYVLALDGEKRPCRVRASNAGHALFTGIAYPERAGRVAQTLMDRSFFCGWGVRTVATTEARYNPISYHNGSVWPHDNALIAAGLARYGYRQEAMRIFAGLFDAAGYLDLRRLPELFCGFPRTPGRGPILYPVACMPQAWAAATPLFLLPLGLGLGFDPERKLISFDEPMLPEFLDMVTLRGLALGGDTVDVMLRRSGTHISVDVLARQGDLRILTTI